MNCFIERQYNKTAYMWMMGDDAPNKERIEALKETQKNLPAVRYGQT
jgi:hypothetical protein